MPKSKICVICKKNKCNMICIECVERDMLNWEKKMIDKGFKEGRTQTLEEELEFLSKVHSALWGCFEKGQLKGIQKMLEDRIKILSKLEDDEVKDD